jgi:GntR family transcriptional repressor for pyruvate dehydrogenase complex
MGPSTDTVSKLITTKLLSRIIGGVYPAGGKLPTEREIAEEFDVTRNVVREALKRIEALGLIKIRRGSGIYVEDIRETGGVELLDLLIFKEDGEIDFNILRDVIEFYEDTITNVIKLASKRITDEQLRELEKMVADRATFLDDMEKIEKISHEIVSLIVDATQNSFYRLIYNTMLRIPVLSAGFFTIILTLKDDMQPYYERLIEALRKKDQEMAVLLTNRIFEAFEVEAARILMFVAQGEPIE